MLINGVSMTVGELLQKLDGVDRNDRVVVYFETGHPIKLYDVTDASLSTGDPHTDEHTGKAGFIFDKTGPATWLFISVEEAQTTTVKSRFKSRV